MGGSFESPASRIAKWDGTTWSGLDVGVNQGLSALIVRDPGGGEALYAGDVTARRIAKWEGRW